MLEAHPTDSRILLSAGHDGVVIVWDMLVGQCLKRMEIEDENGKESAIFDCRFSPDGLMCAAVDNYGFLTIMGFGSTEQYDKVELIFAVALTIYAIITISYYFPSASDATVFPHRLPTSNV